jgi:cytochrome P450
MLHMMELPSIVTLPIAMVTGTGSITISISTILLISSTWLLLVYKHCHARYKLRQQLPTISWRPRFVNYKPSNAKDANKMASSSITGILPRMKRLDGPYGMYGTIYGLSTAVVHIAHPIPAKAILTGRLCHQKQPAYHHFQNFSGTGVFTADGEEWKVKRASVIHCLLRGSTSSTRLERDANLAAEHVMEGLCETNAVNVVPILQRATIGLIYRFLTLDEWGLKDHPSINVAQSPHNKRSVQLHSYLTSVTHIRMIILAQSRSAWYLLPRWIYRTFSSMYREEERAMIPIRAFAQQAIHAAKPSSPLAMLRDRPSHSTTKDMLDEAVTLLFAGQDTTAATLSWTLHLLSLHPDIQERVAIEVCGTKQVTKLDVSQWTYLDAVLKEAMRLYPVAPFVVRTLPHDVTMQRGPTTVTLPKNALACIWIYSLHRNPLIWDRPNEFDPDRWGSDTIGSTPSTANNSASLRAAAYMPFAAGPRNCVGQPLAHVILRIVLARLLREYRFVDDRLVPGIDPKSLLKDMQAGFTILPQGGVSLKVERRGVI